ncbi:decapping 1 [Striga asiatica]|uniref:Decapping 1 n=1 Tax=Striga asiatica TaxID=4170 RepID=A0A5A7NYD9_STRAF|nr:decapping 1 [Striga asiatica]
MSTISANGGTPAQSHLPPSLTSPSAAPPSPDPATHRQSVAVRTLPAANPRSMPSHLLPHTRPPVPSKIPLPSTDSAVTIAAGDPPRYSGSRRKITTATESFVESATTIEKTLAGV